MPGIGSRKHVHKYHKITIGYTDVWGCALPNCTHYMPKHMESMVIGKHSLCWQCGKELIMNENTMSIDRPICPLCKTGIDVEELDSPLSAIMQQRINKESE